MENASRRIGRTTPRIYVTCLASYDTGKLHGAWLDADQDVNDLQREIDLMLALSPEPGAEEWGIHDHEGFKGCAIHEHEALETISALGALLHHHAALGAALYQHLGSVDEANRFLEEAYAGSFESLSDWAEEFLTETGALETLSASLRGYFDFEVYGSDAELSGDVFSLEVEGAVHVFHGR